MKDNKQKQRDAFAKRLNEICTEAGLRPKYQGRQVDLAKLFGVTQKGARKWLEAEAMPRLTTLNNIALHFGVHTQWLMTGTPPKYLRETPRPETKPLTPEQAELLRHYDAMPRRAQKAIMETARAWTQQPPTPPTDLPPD